MKQVDLRESWNRLSRDYQQQQCFRTDIVHYGVVAPSERDLRLLGDVRGKRILEIGCGGGQNAIALSRFCAGCVAVDQSDEQIAYARALAEQEDAAVVFHRSEMIAFVSGEPAQSYDIVLSAYALQYVEDLRRLFLEVRRVLRPGGLFVFSLDHPINMSTALEGDKVVFTRSYFDEGRMEWEWEHGPDGAREPFYSYHRTTGCFVDLLAASGFLIERLLEPEPVEQWTAPSGDDLERFAWIPADIIFRARAVD